MTIMRASEYHKKIGKIWQNYDNCGLYFAWRKILIFIMLAEVIIASILALFTKDFCREIPMLFGAEKVGLSQSVSVGLSYFVLILLTSIVLTIPHELLHIITFPGMFRKAAIVISPFAVSAAYDGWQPKKLVLKSLLCPFIILTLVILFLRFVLDTPVIMWLLFLNTVLCSSDIFAFFYIRKAVPQNALMYGNYYRCQQNT
ncbi:MAG: DUF3267 domain-containing protein [Oscillospiraceae bacterium]